MNIRHFLQLKFFLLGTIPYFLRRTISVVILCLVWVELLQRRRGGFVVSSGLRPRLHGKVASLGLLKGAIFLFMKLPQPLILQTSSTLLFPSPVILMDLLGASFDSTENLLKRFYKVTGLDVPVDNKTLNNVANGGGKWNTKQKVVLPLAKALREEIEDSTEKTLPFSILMEYFSALEAALLQSDQKSAEKRLETAVDRLAKIDGKMAYQIFSERISLFEFFSEGAATLLFLQNRISAQAQLEKSQDKESFHNLLKVNTCLDEVSINSLYETSQSRSGTDPALATVLFMDFFYQLVACLEIDSKRWFCRGVVDYEAEIKEPGAISQLIAESIRYDDSSIPFGRALLYIGKMLGKIQDKEPLGFKALAQYIPDAVNSDLKAVDPNDQDALDRRAEDAKNNKYRTLCAWKVLDTKKRKMPKNEMLRSYFDALMEGVDDSDEGALFLFLTAKMALGFGKMHDDLLREMALEKKQLNTIFDRYFEYYEFTITRLEQNTE